MTYVTRRKLNKIALERGIENPESYSSKAKLIEALDATIELENVEVVPEAGAVAPVASQDFVKEGQKTAQENIEKERAENQPIEGE